MPDDEPEAYMWQRVCQTLAEAEVECSTYSECISSLLSLASTSGRLPVVRKIEGAELEAGDQVRLRRILEEIDRLTMSVDSGRRMKMDRTITRVRRALPVDERRTLALKDLDHPRKLRRLRARRTLAEIGVGSEGAHALLRRFKEGDEEWSLELVARDPFAVVACDVRLLLANLEEEYWRMRVLHGLLLKAPEQAGAFAEDYPFEYIYAVGRLADSSNAESAWMIARDRLDDPEIAGILAWTLGRLRDRERLSRLRTHLIAEGRVSGREP